MKIIPFKEPGDWQAQITLTGTIFNLRFKWNALNKYWSMNIYNRNEEPIIYGIKVVVNWNLTQQYVKIGMPAGQIVCQNILGLSQIILPSGALQFVQAVQSFQPIQRFSMGENEELFYYEPGELESLVT